MSAYGPRLLSWPQVREKVGISRTTAWRLQKKGAFPRPVEISAGRVGWRQEDIEAWAANLTPRVGRQPRLRLLPPEPTSPSTSAPKPAARPLRASQTPSQLGFDF